MKKFLLIFSLTLLMSACAKPKAQLSVSKTEIKQGESVSVNWQTKNSKTVTLNGQPVGQNGSQLFQPQETTTYELIGTRGSKAAKDKQIVKVVVAAVTPIEKKEVEIVKKNVTPPNPPEGVEKPGITVADWFKKNIRSIYFDFDRSDLRPEAVATLKENAQLLLRNDTNTIVFRIEGNCDERGSEEYNLALGDRRSNIAKTFLISQGIDPARMDVISNGKRTATGTKEGSPEFAPSWAHDRRDDTGYLRGGQATIKDQ